MLSIIIGIGILCILAILWYLPRIQLNYYNPADLSPSDQIDLENKLRQTIIQILGGTLVLVGLYLNYSASNSLSFVQNTDVLASCVRQLNDPLPVSKMEAIHTMSEMTSRSLSDKSKITEILKQYIVYSKVDDSTQQREDIELILKLFGQGVLETSKLKLRNLRFKNLDLSNLNFSSVQFLNCTFDSCNFNGTQFNLAVLTRSRFTKCKMMSCGFEKVNAQAVEFSFSLLNDVRFDTDALESASFFQCVLKSAQFIKVAFGQVGESKNGYDPILKDSIGISYRQTRFEKCDLGKIKFHDCNLEDAIILN